MGVVLTFTRFVPVAGMSKVRRECVTVGASLVVCHFPT